MTVKQVLARIGASVVVEKGLVLRIECQDGIQIDGRDFVYGTYCGTTDKNLYYNTGLRGNEESDSIPVSDIKTLTIVPLEKFALVLNTLR